MRIGIICFILMIITIAIAQERVFFIGDEPVIDGKKKDLISEQSLRDFNIIQKSSESLPEVKVSYFLGYNSQYLYIYIEANSDSMIIRDRAYQNGDGFHFMIGFAQENEKETDEFYVFGFSPTDDWTNKIRWYYNVDLSMRRLGDNVLFESAVHDGKIGFELLMPWSNMKPYHPWIHENLAFNLCFVKAIYDKDKIYYLIEADDRLQSEQSRRKYVRLEFDPPNKEGEFFSMPNRHNYTKDEIIKVRIVGFSERKVNKNFRVDIMGDDQTIICSDKCEFLSEIGLSEWVIELTNNTLLIDNYKILVYDGKKKIGEHLISVFDNIDFEKLRNVLSEYKDYISESSHSTLLFYIEELEKEHSNLKYYESSDALVSKLKEIDDYYDEIIAHKDPLIDKKGTFRRAFLSEYDHTLRPYSVYIPPDYNPDSKYPLLVYLHGSGQDDRALFTTEYIKEGFIILAPNGRGTSNCFATHDSQLDIKEAIGDILQNYNIDTDKIILSGFSMGGYGVYRTYYEHRDIFCALAVFSGHPNLANKWGVGDQINFLDEEVVKIFSDIPIFIYHGRKDLNCPFELTNRFVQKLSASNPNIVFEIDNEAGHNIMNQQIREKYYKWLKQQI